MHFDFTPDQCALRREARAYFTGLMTPAEVEALADDDGGPVYKRLIRQTGQDGWLAVGWPVEYGGRGYKAIEQLIVLEEALRAGAPIPFVTVYTVGPALIAHGSEAHKARFLPGIARGETHFSIGYTETEAGTDLAALRTSAVRDGDDYVVNGTKVFTSQAEAADFVWLAARTEPDAPPHKGISILIVDTKDPGFSVAPIWTLGNRTNITRYDDVRVPADMLVGEPGGGWRLITAQLNHERVALAARSAFAERLFERTLAQVRADGRAERGDVQAALADAYVRLDALRLMNYRLALESAPGPALSSAVKLMGANGLVEVARQLIQAVGLPSLVRRGDAASLTGDLERFYRATQIITFGGGVSEVMGEIVAQFGLGLPRPPRRAA